MLSEAQGAVWMQLSQCDLLQAFCLKLCFCVDTSITSVVSKPQLYCLTSFSWSWGKRCCSKCPTYGQSYLDLQFSYSYAYTYTYFSISGLCFLIAENHPCLVILSCLHLRTEFISKVLSETKISRTSTLWSISGPPVLLQS